MRIDIDIIFVDGTPPSIEHRGDGLTISAVKVVAKVCIIVDSLS